MLRTDAKRTICEATRELYRYVIKHNKGAEFADMEELLVYIYISAKKMSSKLNEYKNNIPYNPEQGEKCLKELSLIKKEFV